MTDNPEAAVAPPQSESTHSRPAAGAALSRRLTLTSVALAASGSTAVIFNVVLARTLEPREFGDLARTYSLAMLVAQLTMAGLSPALARIVARGSDDAHRLRLARSALRIFTLAVVGVSALYIPLAEIGLAPPTGAALASGWMLALVYPLYFGLKMLLFALDEVRLYTVLEGVSDALFVGLLALLILTTPGGAVFAFGVAYSVFVVIAAGILLRRPSVGRAPIRIRRDLGLYAVLSMVATYGSIARFPVVVALAGLVGTSRNAAELAVAFSLLAPLTLLPQAAGTLTFVDVARAGAAGAAASIRRLIRIISVIGGLATIACVLFARPLIELVVGADYVSVATVFSVVAVSFALRQVTIPIGNALAGEGSVGITAGYSLLGLAIAVVGTVLAVPSLGTLGGGIAVAVSNTVTAVVSFVFGRAHFDVRAPDVLRGIFVLAPVLVALVVLRPQVPASVVLIVIGVIVCAADLVRQGRVAPEHDGAVARIKQPTLLHALGDSARRFGRRLHQEESRAR